MRWINLLLMCILMLSLQVCAESIEETDYLGVSQDDVVLNQNSNVISDSGLDLQIISADNVDNQIGVSQVTYDEQKQVILTYISQMWRMIGGLFVIMFQLLKGVFYVIEIYLFMLFVFKIIPEILIKIKEEMANWYLRKIQK